MGSLDRSKKKIDHVWKKAVVHFLLCFVMGFLTGFAPTIQPSYIIKSNIAPYTSTVVKPTHLTSSVNNNISFSEDAMDSESMRQVIVVTPTKEKDPLRGLLLGRMANTLKLVSSPLLWIVVETNLEDSDVSDILRKSGVMYRHLVVKENFTDSKAEIDFQRNMALKHIEHHRLSGIVHFAGLSNVYDLSFFDEIRAIEAFGAWPIAKVSRKRKRAIIEGPVCESSQVIGWHLKPKTDQELANNIHISGFGFNSSILWDPERWGPLSSTQEGTKQNSLKFVKQAVTEDETKLKGVGAQDCSKVNLWQLHLSTITLPLNLVKD